MPKERIIPGYFDDIDSFHIETSESPAGDEEARPYDGEQTCKPAKRRGRKRKDPASEFTGRAYIPDELVYMLGLYKIRRKQLGKPSLSNGVILREAFCYWVRHQDRKAYEDFVSKDLI